MKRLGILGGTFDPIHCGHLVIAEEARVRLDLEEVRFIPAGQPPHKVGRPVTAAADRLAMVRLAIAGNSAFSVSTMEIERPGPSYTVDTLAQIQREEGSDCALFFIVGGDALPDLLTWRDPDRLLELCTLVAFRRPNAEPADLERLRSRLPAVAQKLEIIEGQQMAVSGTEIRRLVCAGVLVGDRVPAPVAAYIADHGLYR
ncbi:MAG TPA: nicotinate-nucleotide adenylyltransferase [Chloroflexota bacterium]|nr:nicotinate-nucleotide adenylyltransferase [Chloroflexota bacterium]